MNLSPRLRFKLERLRRDVETWWSRRHQTGAMREASHRMCPSCRALIGRSESVCPLCGVVLRGAPQRGMASQGFLGGVIPIPSSATATLVSINVGLYLLSLYLTFQAADAELSPTPGWGGIRGDVLVALGSRWGPDILRGEWWRLVTAVFLHGGFIHIAFNMWVLFDMGHQVEELFGTRKFVALYLVCGISGFLVSLFWSRWSNSVGASGAVLGLVGVLIGASFHHGRRGEAHRAMLIRWFIYILVLGLVIPGVDNSAHLGGIASGVALGYGVPQGEPDSQAGENLWNLLALVSVLIIAVCFVIMALRYSRTIS